MSLTAWAAVLTQVAGRSWYWKTQMFGCTVAFQKGMKSFVNVWQKSTNSSTPAPGPAAGASQVPKASISDPPTPIFSQLNIR